MVKITDIDQGLARISEEDFNAIRDFTKGVYVEVGTLHGASAYAASENALVVYSIDIYDWQPKVSDDPKIRYFKGTSEDFVKANPNLELDTIFIDGSHENDSVKRDCDALIPLVKRGGIIMFDDYNANNPATGVYSAVNDAIKTYNLTIIQETNYPTCSVLICKNER